MKREHHADVGIKSAEVPAARRKWHIFSLATGIRLLVADASLKLLFANHEAIAILTYPEPSFTDARRFVSQEGPSWSCQRSEFLEKRQPHQSHHEIKVGTPDVFLPCVSSGQQRQRFRRYSDPDSAGERYLRPPCPVPSLSPVRLTIVSSKPWRSCCRDSAVRKWRRTWN